MTAVNDSELTLSLGRLEDLFVAPAVNPLSQHKIEILGECGIEHLITLIRARWPRRTAATRLKLQLDAAQLPAEPRERLELAQTTHVAIARYCSEMMESKLQERARTKWMSWRKLIFAVMVLIVAVGLLAYVVNGGLNWMQPFFRGVFVVLVLFVASLSLWDALTELFFDWAPYVIDRHTYARISGLEIVIEAQPASAP